MKKCFAVCVISSLLAGGLLAQDKTPATAPAQVEKAATTPAETEPSLVKPPADAITGQEKMRDWVNSFLSKTQADVVKQLGTTKRTIDSDGDPVLEYKVADRIVLTFYFNHRGRVILVSYRLMSD